MFKKLFFTAVAAAAVSVPLAGAAWADTGDPNGNGLGQGGMPNRLGDFAAQGIDPALGGGDPIPPGQEFNQIKDVYKTGPGVSTPDAIAQFESNLWASGAQLLGPDGKPLVGPNGQPVTIPSTGWENITPGQAIKPLAPSCGKGQSKVPGNTQCIP